MLVIRCFHPINSFISSYKLSVCQFNLYKSIGTIVVCLCCVIIIHLNLMMLGKIHDFLIIIIILVLLISKCKLKVFTLLQCITLSTFYLFLCGSIWFSPRSARYTDKFLMLEIFVQQLKLETNKWLRNLY